MLFDKKCSWRRLESLYISGHTKTIQKGYLVEIALWLVGLFGSFCSIISLWLYFQEKSKRRKQIDVFHGFLIGLSSHTEAAAQAGEEWRYNVGKGIATPENAKTYANDQVNWYLKINKKISELKKAIENNNIN